MYINTLAVFNTPGMWVSSMPTKVLYTGTSSNILDEPMVGGQCQPAVSPQHALDLLKACMML